MLKVESGWRGKREDTDTAHRSFYRSHAFKVLLAMYLLSYLLFLPLADELAEKVRGARRSRPERLVGRP